LMHRIHRHGIHGRSSGGDPMQVMVTDGNS
jgi:hypothetical protein